MRKAISLIFLLLAPSAMAQVYSSDWYVIGSGGGHSESDSYAIDGTFSEAVTGRSESDDYIVVAGFWAGVTGPVCRYIAGNANGVSPFNGIDVIFSVNYLKGIGSAPPDTCNCRNIGVLLAAADANGDCSYNGIDVTFSVNYLKGFGGPPRGCPSCAPAGYQYARRGNPPAYPGGLLNTGPRRQTGK